MTHQHEITIGAAAIASGLFGGVLFAFSSFVMPALRRIPPAQGISAMQSINRQATTFAFGALIAITFLLAAGVGVQAAIHRDQPGAGWVGAGTISMMIAFAITAAFNVPRNNRLAGFDASTPDAAHYWSTFLTEWIIANHLRTACCVIAAASYTMALRQA
jgi:uncharacterized membrane protein